MGRRWTSPRSHTDFLSCLSLINIHFHWVNTGDLSKKCVGHGAARFEPTGPVGSLSVPGAEEGIRAQLRPPIACILQEYYTEGQADPHAFWRPIQYRWPETAPFQGLARRKVATFHQSPTDHHRLRLLSCQRASSMISGPSFSPPKGHR